jgi:ABC-type transport system substrate-binding protein
VDDLLDRARKAGTEAKQLALYRRAEKEILKEVPIVPIGSFDSFWAARPEVSGLRFDVMGGFDAAGASIDAPEADDDE